MPTGPTPVVLRADVLNGILVVRFDDAHEMQWLPNRSGRANPGEPGGAQDLEVIRLLCGLKLVTNFISPYQNPVQQQLFGFNEVADGYTTQKFVSYWLAAQHYIEPRCRQLQVQCEAQNIIRLGKRDLAAIQNNEWRI